MLKNRIIVFGLLCTTSVLVYLEPNFITVLLFYLLTFVILFSFFHLLLANRNIVVTQILDPNKARHSAYTKYTFRIQNRSILPYPVLNVRFKYTENIFTDQISDLKLALLSEESLEFNYNLSCKYRGTYPIGTDKIEIQDILSIFSVTKEIRTPTITVLPNVSKISLNSLKPKYLFGEYDLGRSSTQDEDTIKDIREYQKGDSLKDVHWKLYAKYNTLMVREKDNSAFNKSILFLDTKELDSSLVDNIIYQDKLLEAFLSTAFKLIEDNHILDILIDDRNLIEDDFYIFESIFGVTADVVFGKKETSLSIEDFIYKKYNNKNLSGIDLFVFTLKDSDNLQNVLKKLVASSMTVHVVESNPSLDENTFISDNHIRYHHLDANSSVGDLTKEIR